MLSLNLKKEKDKKLAKAREVAAAKRADREKIEILRLGKGDMDRGVEAFNERMRKDKEIKAQKDALEMSQDADKTFKFWNYIC